MLGKIEQKDMFEIIREERQNIFVETGTQNGNGVRWAMNYFDEIFSIEILQGLHDKCKKEFKLNENINLYLGNSAVELPKILSGLNEPIFFWLDAHGNSNPLLKELEIIKEYSVKNNVIVIDDVRLMGGDSAPDWKKITKDLVISKLSEINPEFIILEYNDTIVSGLKEDLFVKDFK
jgi:hypothetical protein|tara:strand:- start:779 stop:1309 length:531 start_codon:yes stop_codon:yes gene_type:complete